MARALADRRHVGGGVGLQAYRGTGPRQADRQTMISNLVSGRYERPVSSCRGLNSIGLTELTVFDTQLLERDRPAIDSCRLAIRGAVSVLGRPGAVEKQLDGPWLAGVGRSCRLRSGEFDFKY